MVLTRPGRGRADEPAPACTDSEPTWWTGKDLPASSGGPPLAGRVFIRVTNAGKRPLFFPGHRAQKVRFDILASTGGGRRALVLPENEFCATTCPIKGPPQEIDCGRPAPLTTELAPGATLDLRWSGEEAVTVQRRCGNETSAAMPCQQRKPTVAGRYQLELCARVGSATGPRRCQRLSFKHPAPGAQQYLELSYR